MTTDVQKTLIQVNGVSIPGILRDGAFIGESPLSTFVQYRAVNLDTGETRRFIVDIPCTVETIIIADSANNPTYNFTVTTPQQFVWMIAIPSSQIVNYGSTKIINFPQFVLDRGFIVSFTPTVAITSMAIFTKPALNIDVRDF